MRNIPEILLPYKDHATPTQVKLFRQLQKDLDSTEDRIEKLEEKKNEIAASIESILADVRDQAGVDTNDEPDPDDLP